MSAHTPGPWTVVEHRTAKTTRTQVWQDKSKEPLALPFKVVDDVTFPNDAALIATAPELLEALKEATRCLAWHQERHGVGMDKKAVEDARAAIAKATGGAA